MAESKRRTTILARRTTGVVAEGESKSSAFVNVAPPSREEIGARPGMFLDVLR